MEAMKDSFSISSSRRIQLVDITRAVQKRVEEAKLQDGFCVLFCPHTTAGLAINENADPDVASDLERAFEAMVPEVPFRHAEGNSPAHLLQYPALPPVSLLRPPPGR